MENQSQIKAVAARLARTIEITGIDGGTNYTFNTGIIAGDSIMVVIDPIFQSESENEAIARGELYKFICDLMGVKYTIGA